MVEDTARSLNGADDMKLRYLILAIITFFIMATPALAASVGVHMHNQPGSTGTSGKIVADIYGGSQYYLTSFVIDAALQSGDEINVYMQDYSKWSSGSSSWDSSVSFDSSDSFPRTVSVPGNIFAAWIELTTSSGSTGCSIAYFSQATNNNNITAYYDPITCGPVLPPPPAIPEAPAFNIVQPNLLNEAITIPESPTFDGTYNYQEPAREGAYSYTPPSLDIPDPIPSPPPPPEGPGLFDFSTIMQTIGTPDAPITSETPVSGNIPIQQNPPSAGDAPKTVEQPGAIDNVTVSTPINATPAQQPDTPISVQSGVVDPAIMAPVLTVETPLQPQTPLEQD